MKKPLVFAFGAGCAVMSGTLTLLNQDPHFHSILWAGVMFGGATMLALFAIITAIAVPATKSEE